MVEERIAANAMRDAMNFIWAESFSEILNERRGRWIRELIFFFHLPF